MTGAYLRVKRDGKWQNIEVEYLTREERKEALKDSFNTISWIDMLCEKLLEYEEILDGLVEDGLLEKRRE